MRMTLKRDRCDLHSFTCGRGHRRRVAVARRTLRTGHDSHRGGTLMLLVTSGAGAILHHIGLVKCVDLTAEFEMTVVASFVDQLGAVGGDSVAETLPHHLLESS